MFKYKYNNKTGNCSGSVCNQFGIANELAMREEFQDGDLILKVVLEKENEFGKFEADFFHQINGQKAIMTHYSFVPHKEIKDQDASK